MISEDNLFIDLRDAVETAERRVQAYLLTAPLPPPLIAPLAPPVVPFGISPHFGQSLMPTCEELEEELKQESQPHFAEGLVPAREEDEEWALGSHDRRMSNVAQGSNKSIQSS
jgi:hypothetical protein